MHFLKILVLILLGTLIFVSCKDKEGYDPCSNNFDQEAMFTNIADNIIIPNYTSLKEKVDELQVSTQDFITDPTDSKLSDLRESFKNAYIVWQKVAQFGFGPAEDVFLRESLNNFPVNKGQVEFNIENDTNNFDDPETYDQGFPALDYLLFGVAGTSDLTETTNFYLNNVNTANYKSHLEKLVLNIQQKVNYTLDTWNDSFRDAFVKNTGTADGGSLSQIVNNWNLNYELIKRDKLGTPSGVLDLNFPLPDKVEAFYSGISVTLATTAIEAARDLYLGTGVDGQNRLSLDDFLVEINAEKDMQSLDQVIKDRFNNAITMVSALVSPLSESIEADDSEIIAAYNETAKQVVAIKTDLPSVLCISITYVDNPSDSD